MSDARKTVYLRNAQQAGECLRLLYDWAKPFLLAGHQFSVKAGPITRSLEQNAKLHSCLADISKQVEWHGQRFSTTTWKRLCVAAWLRESGESPELVPALDGNGFDVIYEKTSKLSLTQCSSLIEWVIAFGTERGVSFEVDHELQARQGGAREKQG